MFGSMRRHVHVKNIMYKCTSPVYTHPHCIVVYIFSLYCDVHTPSLQGRRSRCGRCGGRRTNNMLSLASRLLNLAVSSQDCTRNDLRTQTPLCDALCTLTSLLGWHAIAPPRFHRSKRSLPDQTKIASYGPVLYCGVHTSSLYCGVLTPSLYCGVHTSSLYCGVHTSSLYCGVHTPSLYCGVLTPSLYCGVHTSSHSLLKRMHTLSLVHTQRNIIERATGSGS